jgi:predicted glycoside hydrolase/deacetylase ChbG (UPF0249 family)
MLIINADDFGRDNQTTNNILECFRHKRINSSSAMVFMEDSERSAELAKEYNLETGLHLNFTESFTGYDKPRKIEVFHNRISKYLSKNKYALIVYNPFLKKDFDYMFKMQYDEYLRLYNDPPSHINGHQHMHLSMNMLLGRIIPKGHIVRRNHTFKAREKDLFNFFYRLLVDNILLKPYRITDFFFDLLPIEKERLEKIAELASTAKVELMVHPGRDEEYKVIMSDEYAGILSSAEKSSFQSL